MTIQSEVRHHPLEPWAAPGRCRSSRIFPRSIYSCLFFQMWKLASRTPSCLDSFFVLYEPVATLDRRMNFPLSTVLEQDTFSATAKDKVIQK